MEISKLRHAGISASYAEIVDMNLPFEDESFDVCFSACVFHHISHAEHLHWLAELRRVTRKGGMTVIFEHNPANPLTVSAVRNCPFDENAELIWAGKLRKSIGDAGWHESETVYRMFFPHSLSFARPLERYIRKLPLGAQYFIKARKR
jgi:ubiquinone/menaquinone biosynthesis C-methylase UbiE